MKRYSKAIVAFLGAAATWAAAALDDSHVSNAEWAGLLAAVLGVFAVYQVRNDPGPTGGDSGEVSITFLEVCAGVLAVIALLWAFGVLPR